MNRDEVGPAIARLLMRAAGPGDDAMIAAIEDELGRFDDLDSVTALVCEVAVAAAGRLEVGAAIHVSDTADLIAFGLLQHAAETGPGCLPTHLDGLGYSERAAVAVAMLAIWRSICSSAAAHALADLRIPTTIPEEA